MKNHGWSNLPNNNLLLKTDLINKEAWHKQPGFFKWRGAYFIKTANADKKVVTRSEASMRKTTMRMVFRLMSFLLPYDSTVILKDEVPIRQVLGIEEYTEQVVYM